METVLIGGATGLIGQALAADLATRGCRVVALVRDLERGKKILGSDCSLVLWGDDDGLTGAVAESDVVIQLAGAPILPKPWTRARRRMLRSSRIGTTEALVQAIQSSDSPPRLLITASAVGYYGNSDLDRDEQSPCGEGFAAELCRDWEQTATQAQSAQIRVVCLRIANVIAGGGGVLASMLPIYRARLGGVLGSGRQPFPWIDLDDLITIVRQCMEDDRLEGAVNACVPSSSTYADLHQALRQAVGKQIGIPLPAFMLHSVLGEAGRLLTQGSPVRPQRLIDLGFSWRSSDLNAAVSHRVNAPENAG
jgi:uncharacterized protein (TIGR01777 family)